MKEGAQHTLPLTAQTLDHCALSHRALSHRALDLPRSPSPLAALALAETDWPSLLSKLEAMRSAMVTSDGAVVNLSADGATLASAIPLVPTMVDRLPRAAGHASPGWEWSAAGVLVPATHEGLQVGRK